MVADILGMLGLRKDLPPFMSVESRVCRDFEVSFSQPDAGWNRVSICCDGDSFDHQVSYINCPYEDIKAWLEALAQGEYPAVTIDSEGWRVYWLAGPTNQADTVRFCVVFEHSGPGFDHTLKTKREVIIDQYGNVEPFAVTYTNEYMCDIVLPRRVLIKSVYSGLLAFWEKPDPAIFWREWDNTTPENGAENYDEPYGTWHFSVQSDVIEPFLAE